MLEESDAEVLRPLFSIDDATWAATAEQQPGVIYLKAMRYAMQPHLRDVYPSLLHPAYYFERAARIIWHPSVFAWEAKAGYDENVYPNTYARGVAAGLLQPGEDSTIVTGPGSSSKTYTASAVAYAVYASDPKNTAIIISSTSGQGADTRTWSAIKGFHNAAGPYACGTVLEGHRAITVNEDFAGRKDTQARDLNDGIMITNLPQGNEGLNAAANLVGRKNKLIIWVVDELPFLASGILDLPETNLSKNPMFKTWLLGNAVPGRNPHREACEPPGGWKGFVSDNTDFGGMWRSKSGRLVIFLSGWKSPNCAEALVQCEHKALLPFPSLVGWIDHRKDAMRLGNGDWRAGIKTANFRAMNVGIYDEGGVNALTVLSEPTVPQVARGSVKWGPGQIFPIAAMDIAFTEHGDDNVIMIGQMGYEYETGRRVILLPDEGITVEPDASDDYVEGIAKAVVRILTQAGVEPQRFGLDISNDGGKMLQAIGRAWYAGASDKILAISSQGKASDVQISWDDPRIRSSVWGKRVTEYWMNAARLVRSGAVRGFNVASAYARDMFTREYRHVAKDIVDVIPKKVMKKETGRSPDNGDTFVYLLAVAEANGFTPDLPKPESNLLEGEKERLKELLAGNSSPSSDDGWGGYGSW